LGSSLNFG